MIVFHPPYNSLRRLGQTDVSSAPAAAPAAPVTVVPAPAAVAPAPMVVPAAASGVNFDQGIVGLTPAGLIVGAITAIGLSLTVAAAFAKR